MTNDSIKLAQVWIELRNIKDKLDNEVIPVSGHLGLEDSELTAAMEQLSEKIGNHFKQFKLTAVTQKAETAL